MMNLTIETKNKAIESQINAAYDKAMETSNYKDFVDVMNANTHETIITGLSGSHIWVSDKATGKRHAIIIL